MTKQNALEFIGLVVIIGLIGLVIGGFVSNGIAGIYPIYTKIGATCIGMAIGSAIARWELH